MGDSSHIKQNSEVQFKRVPLDTLVPSPHNYNQHPPAQIADLKASLIRYKQVRPIVVQKVAGEDEYMILAGHGITEAAKELYTENPTKYAHLNEWAIAIAPASWSSLDAKGYMVSDNELSHKAETDEQLLVQLLQEQQDAGYDLASLGSDDETLRQMLESLGDEYLAGDESERDEAEDELPEQVETRAKPGDIWQLGRHKVACMDALDPATYVGLLQNMRPHAIITDPPYGMRLNADFSGMVNKLQFAQEKGIKSGRKYANVIGDHEDFDASPIFSLFSDVKEQFWFGADYYSATLGDTMHAGCWLVWDKRLDESADKMYGSCFELIWSKQKHKRDMLRHKWAGVFGTEHEPQRGRQHPNQKPIRLLEDIISRYTDEGQAILEPFLGSGSTLIAAEDTGRTVIGCELSPEYIDVVISRWEKHTGQTATLLERAEEASHARNS